MWRKRNQEAVRVAPLAEDPLLDQEVRAEEGDLVAAVVVWGGVTFVVVGEGGLQVWGEGVWTEEVYLAEDVDMSGA